MSTLPLVSIIITSYNMADMIGHAIESALAQDYPNLEIIVSDNASSDNSKAVINRYAHDSRMKISFNQENIGMLPNFRRATYELANGELLSYLSSDDKLVDPAFISDSVKLFMANDDLVLAFARLRIVSETGEIIRDSPEKPFYVREVWDGKEVFFKSPESGILSWGACLMRKQILADVKGLHKNYVASDFEANYKGMLHGKVGFINRIGYEAVSHTGNATTRPNANHKISDIECMIDIADYAKSLFPNHEDRVNKWAHYYIYTHGYNELKTLKAADKKEYKVFKSFLRQKFPIIYKELNRNWKLKVHLLLQSIKSVLGRSSTSK